MMRAAWLASLAAGLALMLPFESDLTLILGLTCLGAFIVLGLAIIVQPGFAGGDDEPSAQAAADASARQHVDRSVPRPPSGAG